jgi:hypothetical protein
VATELQRKLQTVAIVEEGLTPWERQKADASAAVTRTTPSSGGCQPGCATRASCYRKRWTAQRPLRKSPGTATTLLQKGVQVENGVCGKLQGFGSAQPVRGVRTVCIRDSRTFDIQNKSRRSIISTACTREVGSMRSEQARVPAKPKRPCTTRAKAGCHLYAMGSLKPAVAVGIAHGP